MSQKMPSNVPRALGAVHAMEDVQSIPPTQRLWQAVIWQAVRDACSRSAASTVKYERSQARHFFTSRTEIFEVCHLAGYNPEWFMEKMAHLTRDVDAGNKEVCVYKQKARSVLGRTMIKTKRKSKGA